MIIFYAITFTGCQRSCWKVMFSQVFVSHSIHMSLPMGAVGGYAWFQVPCRGGVGMSGTSLWKVHPQRVHISLECFVVTACCYCLPGICLSNRGGRGSAFQFQFEQYDELQIGIQYGVPN